MTDNDTIEKERRKPRAVMLWDEEYERILKVALKYGDDYSGYMRKLGLQAAERDEQKIGQNNNH